MEYLNESEIRRLLGDYYDIPALIQDRLKMIKELQLQVPSVIHSPIITGMPAAPHGEPSDPTFKAMASMDTESTRKAVAGHFQAIQSMQEKRNWLCAALATLDRTDRIILQMAYMGPEDAEKRRQWTRRPPWLEIADEVDYSRSQTMDRAGKAIKKLSELSVQQAFTVYTA